MTCTLDDLRAVVGREVPGGRYTIEPWRAWLTHDAILAPPPGEWAHPAFVFMAATGSMGLRWDELFAWFGASATDGPMFGDCHIVQSRPLRVGATYRVSGRIVSAERKTGRKVGTFDLAGYLLELHDDANAFAASCRNSIVFPRRA
jgi:hypothetical protein